MQREIRLQTPPGYLVKTYFMGLKVRIYQPRLLKVREEGLEARKKTGNIRKTNI